MAEHRWLIAITPEEPVGDEGRKVEALLREGWHRVHLRHPHASRSDVRSIIESIAPEWHNRIVLHGHFDLTHDFNLGGLHLNRRCPSAPALYRGALSRSCHSTEEAAQCSGMSYVTLSPIFDSISKAGYRSAFTPESLATVGDFAVPVIALGGIEPRLLDRLAAYPFRGYAMLGAIPWEGITDEVRDFARECINKIKNIL